MADNNLLEQIAKANDVVTVMGQRIDSFTQAQQDSLPGIRDEWIKIGLATGPGDRAAVEEAIGQAYQIAGLPPPKQIIWLRSPIEGCKEAYRLTHPEASGPPTKEGLQAQIELACLGSHDSGWLSYYDTFDRFGMVAAMRLRPFVTIAKNAGWWWPLDEAAIVTERPIEIHLNDKGQLHCENAPAILYADGFAVYAVNGVRKTSSSDK